MEVHLTQNQESELNELAVKTGRGTDELVQEPSPSYYPIASGSSRRFRLALTRSHEANSSKKKRWTSALSACSSLETHSLGSRRRG